MRKLLNVANRTIDGLLSKTGIIRDNFNKGKENSTLLGMINKKTEQLPQYDYLFLVSMPDVFEPVNQTEAVMNDPDFSMESYSSGSTFIPNIDPEEINHRVFSIDIPFTSFDTAKNTHGTSFWYSAKHNDIGSISMRIDEMEDNATLTYLQSWFNRIKNKNGTYNPPAFYKRNIRLIRLSGSKEELTVSDYVGCFPTSISEVSLSNDNGGITQYNVTLSVDDVTHRTEPPARIKKAIDAIQEEIKRGATAPKAPFKVDENVSGKILEKFASIFL